jgi:hypothetical protein
MAVIGESIALWNLYGEGARGSDHGEERKGGVRVKEYKTERVGDSWWKGAGGGGTIPPVRAAEGAALRSG